MQISIGVEYALHTLFYMIDAPSKIGIKELAELNKLPESYLSKIFTKLKKAEIVRSVPGVNGGYELMKKPDDISFWDVIQAIEGSTYMFKCLEIRENNILKGDTTYSKECPCLIKVVINDAEEQMRNYLRNKSLAWLHNEVAKDFSDEKKKTINNWLENNKK